MTLALADREALVEPVRRLLADRCTEADVRRIMETPEGHDPALWRALCDLGVPAIAVAEGDGGLGLGAAEVELVMEEAGAMLLPSPLLSSVTAAALLAGSGDSLLADVAGGRLVAVAFAGAHDWSGRGGTTVAGGRATGTARFVPDAAVADVVLIAGDDGVFAVEDFAATPLPTFDRTRRMADVTLDAPARQVAGAEAVASGFARAVVALAGEQAGIARAMLDRTVDYARQRHQFGRAIGSFQAIKHMAADLLLESESATSAARDAARQIDEGAATRDAAVALAAFACADAAVRVCADGIQMHGGIAFTWEHPAHLYLRRARSGAQLFGDADAWRDRYLAALEAQA